MAVRVVQNSFVSGELSPELWGRHDIKAYFNGAAEISNFIPRRTGGLRKRAGTNLLYELTSHATLQVGKLFLCFPFMYDNDSCGIVYLYARTTANNYYTIYAGMIAVVAGTTYTAVAPDSLSISSKLKITSQKQFASIRAKQIGDTLFFTRNRKSAFKCAVTFNKTNPASSTLVFSMVAQTDRPAMPDDFTITAAKFKFRDKFVDFTTTPPTVNWDNYGYTATTRTYALYGVKDGIFSTPKTKTISYYMPWTAGAYIEIKFSPNWDAYDYYVLGKQNGSQYGIIGEFHPNANFELPDVVFDSLEPPGWNTLSGSFLDNGRTYLAAPAYGSSGALNSIAVKLAGDPDETAYDSTNLNLQKYATIYKAYTVDTTRTIVLPQYYFTGATGFAGGRARLCLGGTVLNADALSVVNVNYATGTPMEISVVPFNFAAKLDGTEGELVEYAAQTLTIQTTDGISYVDVDLSAYDPDTNPGGIRPTWGADGADGYIKHIGFKIVYTGLDTRMDDCVVLNGVAFDLAASGAFPTGDLVPCESYDSLVYGYDSTAPEATYSETGDYQIGVTEYQITCAYNDFNAVTDTVIADATRYAAYTADTKPEVAVTSSLYHKNSLIIDDDGAIIFTWGAATATTPPTSLKLWTGALMRNYITEGDGSIARGSPNPGGSTSVKLFQKNTAGAWIEIGKWDVWMSYRQDPVLKDITKPLLTGGTNYYKIKFENPSAKSCVIRGLALVGLAAEQTFKDDNIAAGSLTGVQTQLTVGDTNMDCRTMDIWQQRLVMASSDNLPFTMWFSTVGDLYNFYVNRPQLDSDAFSVTIPATRASKILHLVSGRWLTIFTESGEYILDAGDEGLSYRTVNIKQVSSVGIHADIEPLVTEDRIVFVAHDGRSVYEMRYDLAQDGVIPIERSILAHHLTENATIVKAAYQRFPDSVIWFLLSDGTMLSMTFMPDQDVIAWARHSFAQPAGYTDGTLKCVDIFSTGSVLTTDGCEPTSDIILVWDVLDVNSAKTTKTIIERMRPAICTDAPTTANAKCVDHVGIANAPNVQGRIVTLRPETPDFVTQGLKKSVLDVIVRLRRTYSFSVVSNETDDMTSVNSVIGSTRATSVTLSNADKKVAPRGNFNDNGQMIIASADGKPCEILSLVFVMEVQQ